MTKMSPHTRWKGCPVCKPHKIKGAGAAGVPFAARRQLGKRRRITRPSREDW